jgi:transcriptional regulator with GAF, ATPase, and Fis domain
MTAARFVIRHVTSAAPVDYPLRQRIFLIGSAGDNDLVISGGATPAVALKIEPFKSGYRCVAATMKSFLLNGKRLKLTDVLTPGDAITLGKERFVFEAVPAGVSVRCTGSSWPPENFRQFIEDLGRERRLQPLLQKLLHILLEVTGGTDVFLFKLSSDGKPQVFESNGTGKAEDRFSDTIVQAVLDSKKGICIPNALADPAYQSSQSICDLKLRSVLCTPIMSAGNCVGLIYIGSHNPAVSFTPDDLECVSIYAAITGMLIHHIDFIVDQQSAIERVTGAVSNDGIIAASLPMQKVVAAVHAIAAAEITVLLEGETGTGKNRIAELIHRCSPRAAGPFVVVNCSALHGELLESELFGHTKGSFTGATGSHDGLFAAAQGGTLFLDEIGELEPSLQAKLLRTLESGNVRPVGSSREFPVDVRVVCATNRDLKMMVEERSFRADLFYRINQFLIVIPPLRERGEDTTLLAWLFLTRYKAEYPDRTIIDFHPETLRHIRSYSWPGNIRELSNAIHRAVLTSHGPLLQFDLPEVTASTATDFETASRQFQKKFLENAIQAAGGNKELAAQNAGLSRSTFYRYLAQYKI